MGCHDAVIIYTGCHDTVIIYMVFLINVMILLTVNLMGRILIDLIRRVLGKFDQFLKRISSFFASLSALGCTLSFMELHPTFSSVELNLGEIVKAMYIITF